jgi:hypothetical protein
MGFRWIDIRNIWEKVYLLETWMDAWFLAFTRIEFEWNKFIAYREWLDLEKIYWKKIKDENFSEIFSKVKYDFTKIN